MCSPQCGKCSRSARERALAQGRTDHGYPRRCASAPVRLPRIGNNLNQIARLANRYRGAGDAAQVIAHLVALDREVRQLLLTRDPDLPPREEEGPC